MNQKSTKNPPKFGSWGLLGRLVGLLEGSWAHLGSKSQQVTKKVVRWTPLAPPSWTPNPTKLIRIRSGGVPKSSRFFDWFWGRVLMPFGANMVPTWPPKTCQNQPKLVPKSIKKKIKMLTIFLLQFGSFWRRFFMNFASKLEGRGTKKH